MPVNSPGAIRKEHLHMTELLLDASLGTRAACSVAEPAPMAITIQAGSRGAMVTIQPDGSIEYGQGYTPDAAAKIFWDAVGLERKNRQ